MQLKVKIQNLYKYTQILLYVKYIFMTNFSAAAEQFDEIISMAYNN